MKHGQCLKDLNPHFLDHSPPDGHPSHFISFWNLTLLTFSGKIATMKYQINKKINSWGKVISSSLEDYKITCLTCLFISNTFTSNTRLRFGLPIPDLIRAISRPKCFWKMGRCQKWEVPK